MHGGRVQPGMQCIDTRASHIQQRQPQPPRLIPDAAVVDPLNHRKWPTSCEPKEFYTRPDDVTRWRHWELPDLHQLWARGSSTRCTMSLNADVKTSTNNALVLSRYYDLYQCTCWFSLDTQSGTHTCICRLPALVLKLRNHHNDRKKDKKDRKQIYSSNVRRRCGQGNAHFISFRQVSLLVRRRRCCCYCCCIRQFAN